MRLDDRDVERRGSYLEDLSLDFIVTGGIASVESAKVIRELRRYGANVRAVMTKSAGEFITPRVLEWASKKPVLSDLTGAAEHLTTADAVLVAPATLDFIQRISLGLADSLPASLVQSMIGRRPLILVPSMHESLWENPFLQESLKRLQRLKNVFVIEPMTEEGKQKQRNPESLVAEVCHLLSRSALKDKGVVVTAGPTRSYVDDVRFLSNFSTGSLGTKIAEDFYRSGARVKLIHGPSVVKSVGNFEIISVETSEEMRSALRKSKADVYVFSAAVLDFDVKKARSGKTSSKTSFSIDLVPARKLIDEFKNKKGIKVGFKLESRISEGELKKKVLEWMKQKPCQVVICNRLEDVKAKSHRAFLWSDQSPDDFQECSSKQEISATLVQIVSRYF